MKKLCATGLVVAAAGAALATAASLAAVPAGADTAVSDSSSNRESSQSGNIFGTITVQNRGTGASTNVTSVNANTSTAARRSGAAVSNQVD
ncbi:hypothetical protein [Nonomuraea roseoviolacea]|uniref:Secreted protein n=1 Tax=Nonomuraea roseoviolacea subsp. carminata TaxID=160689 RepID=A0ABT1JUQ2_9ACTN|nr:hypothetical protein [Nonomuraea roseoviolacea]MCP2345006.1 hypothetical protein [Nonomuraea roseoviolacea subsp. carminata]